MSGYTRFKQQLDAFVDKLNNLLGDVSDPLVSEVTTLAADAALSYDLGTLLGEDVSGFDALGVSGLVRVKDTDTTSPTHGFYVNAEALVTIGVSTAGMVKIHNFSADPLELKVKIMKPERWPAA